MIAFATYQDAWVDALRALRSDGARVRSVLDHRSVGSTFGEKERPFIELVGAGFRVTDPRARLFAIDGYCPDITFAIAMFLWVLAGSDDVEAISFYNARGRLFSDDGRTLTGAPGKRVFHSSAGDQFSAAVRTLHCDSSSRRAMIQVFLPEDGVERRRDTPCLGSIQLLLRGDHLHAVTTMRSQSAARVLPYDTFLVSLLHEAAALELGVGLGTHHVFCGSLHFYESESQLVDQIIRFRGSPPQSMQAMQSVLSAVRPALCNAEHEIRLRLGRDPRAPVELAGYGFDPYWNGLLQALVVGVRLRHGVQPTAREREGVPEELRRLLNPQPKDLVHGVDE